MKKDKRFYRECEDGIENIIPRISLASRGLLSDETGDSEVQIVLSHPHMHNGFFFLLTIKY